MEFSTALIMDVGVHVVHRVKGPGSVAALKASEQGAVPGRSHLLLVELVDEAGRTFTARWMPRL